jgi:ribosomal protein S18 acetylase RimI-like enzyme
VELVFEQASLDDCEKVHAILTAAGLDLQQRSGLSHWVPAYPLSLLRAAADAGRVYLVRSETNLVGTYTVGRDAPDYVPPDAWSEAGDPALYVTRLAVHPTYQGTGIGHVCMRHIESDARREHLRAVRLDANAEHELLLRFYRDQGYEQRVRFQVYGTELVCFEKTVSPAR